MGRTKQLLPFGDRPAVVRCIESIIGAGTEDIVVVLSPDSQEIAEAIASLPVTVARVEASGTDMVHSLRTGFGKVKTSSSAVFVCLADHPLVKAETLAAMRRCYERMPERIILPLCQGKKGHPPLLPANLLKEIYEKPTLRELIGWHEEKVYFLEVEDEGVLLDMDTWEDYRSLCKRFFSDRADAERWLRNR